MGLTRLAAVIALAPALLFFPNAVVGQSSNVVCSADYAWAKNSRGQSPCLVAAYAQGACTIKPWNVSALPTDDYHYVGPYAEESDPCQCSTVTYSLISACGGCQGARWIDWDEWSFNCTRADTSIGQFPMQIPAGTSIPTWAYLDVSLANTWSFNASRANALLGLPDEGAAPSTSSSAPPSTVFTTVRPSTTPDSSPTSDASTGGNGSSSSSGPPIGAIVGGVVGGLVGLGLLIVLAVVVFKKKQNAAYSTSSGTPVGKQPDNMPPPPVPYNVPYSPAPQSAFLNNGNNGPYSATPLLAGGSVPATPQAQQYGYGPQGAFGATSGSPAPSQPGYGYDGQHAPQGSAEGAYAGMGASPPPQGYGSPSPPQQQPGYGPQQGFTPYNNAGSPPPGAGGYPSPTPLPYGGPTHY